MNDQEYNDYAYEKSRYYTEKVVNVARERWGDVPLSPKTHTWADGTVSIQIHHTIVIENQLRDVARATLNFQETGWYHTEGPTILETVVVERGDEKQTVWRTDVDVEQYFEAYEDR